MGLLSEGQPLSWDETKKLSSHVRQHGIEQFINLYHRVKDRRGDTLKWGDEIEYIIVKFNKQKKVAQVALKAQEILNILNQKELEDPEGVKSLWRPEYGAYMIEGTPGQPYGGSLSHFNVVEANMRYRREEVSALLDQNESIISITNFPRLGVGKFTYPEFIPTPNDEESAAKSVYFPDEAIYPGHPRFKTLTRNIRMRRGENVSIKLDVFKDINTKIPVAGSPPNQPEIVLLDAMGFGMGCCCLQLTFQACCIEEARVLYDQLTPLCPIMLALTAASPVFRGYLVDSDCRWNIISASVDCRTAGERGEKPLINEEQRIYKSRYDSIDSYLSNDGERYNDVPLIYDENIYKRLREGNIDHLLAQHIAHLFIRDSVSLFNEKINQNDKEDTDHFENIQSTNWQTMRFKPPPVNSSIGWRVEFRPCELQITDFENAAVVCFVVLLTRVILSYKLNFLIPISKVDENMQRAQKRNACNLEKFWFRKAVHKSDDAKLDETENTQYEEMTINEIINGNSKQFPGLIPLINSYLQAMDVDADTHCTIQQYLRLIQKRASGELLTTASWIRKEVETHSEYKSDSVVSDSINFDLLEKVRNIQEGKIVVPELLGLGNNSKTKDNIPSAIEKYLQVNDCH